MFLNVFGPLDIAVGGVGQEARLEYQQHILAGEDVDGNFQEGADIPCKPLLTETEQDKQAIRNTDRRSAGIEVADNRLNKLVAAEQVGGDIEVREEVTDHNGPDDNAGNDSHFSPTAEFANLGQFFLLLVRVTVPVDEADDINGDPEEQRDRHGGETIAQNHTGGNFDQLDKQGNNEVPFTLLGNQQFAEDVEESVSQIKGHDDFAVDAVGVLFRENKSKDDRQNQDAEKPHLFIGRKVVPQLTAFLRKCLFCVFHWFGTPFSSLWEQSRLTGFGLPWALHKPRFPSFTWFVHRLRVLLWKALPCSPLYGLP